MRPLSLESNDFMNHKKCSIDFGTFKSALIVGKTKENDAISNGVGKSTIFSAIEWALFNKVHKTTLDKVVREGAKRASVEFAFKIDGSSFKVKRTLSAKKTKNVYLYEFIDDEYQSITQRTSAETEVKLQEILKLSHKAFINTVLFRQADLTGLVEAKDGGESNNKSRADILKEPLNLTRYSKKEKMVADLIKPIKKDIEANESAATVLGNPDDDIKQAKEDLEKTLAQILEKDNVIKTDLAVALEEKRKNLDHLKSTLSSSDADIHSKVEVQHVKIKKLNYSIKELGGSQINTLGTIDSQKDLLTRKEDQLIRVQERFSDKEAEDHRSVTKITTEHKKVCEDELKGNKLLARAEVEHEYAQDSIPKTDNCNSCKQAISKEYRAEFEENVSKIIEEKKSDIDFYKKAMIKCKSVKTKLTKELDGAKQHASDIKSLTENINSIKESIVAFRENISNAEVDASRIGEQLDVQSTELQEAIKHYNDLKEIADKSDMTELNSKIFSIAREIKVYEQSIESMHTETQSLRTREGVLKERIKNRVEDKKKLDTINDKLSKLRHELGIHQRVMSSFSHRGIPTLIINTCLNELQLETNQALQQLRPDLEVMFDADLNFTFRRNGVERDYHQLSYGQHVYIALAFKKGLAAVVQRKMGISIHLLEFDEVDSSLDKAGVEAMANAIKKWQEDFLILTVTHNDSLKDKFSHAIVVEEGDDGAIVSVKTSW